MDREVTGWVVLLIVVVFLWWGALAIQRVDRLPTDENRMVMLLGSLSTTAEVHRDICRLLIADGKHHECGICHAPDEVQAWVAAHKGGWVHMVAMAQHPSWLDWDVHISHIVVEQFRKGTGRKAP